MNYRCIAAARNASRTVSRSSINLSRKRTLATAAVAPDTASSASTSAPTDSKIEQLVDNISGLTLLQASDLVTRLKSRLNIQEIAMPAASAPAAASVAVEEAPVEEKPKEKTIFNVMLESFDAAAKAKIIREVKALVPNLTLIDAKKFVESVPKVLKENLPKEDAEKLKKTIEGLGGVIKLE